MKLKISVNKENELRVSVAELIEKQLEEIGIEVTVEQVSADKYGKYIEEKNYQILLTGVYTSYSPDLTYYFSGGNISNYTNEGMFELLQNASIIKETKQLKAIYEEIYKTYKDDVPFIGLYRNKNITISSQNLVGTIEPNNYTTLYGMENWYRK